MTPTSRPATRDNWRTHPHSVWAFQHIAQLLPTRPVSRGTGPASTLFERPAALDRLRLADDRGVTITWHEFLESTHADAVITLHRGAIVDERYRNGMTPATPHLLFSITKSLVGLLAELLAASGVIDLSRAAAVYVPELADSAFGAATLRDLLDMRDGVAFGEDYADPHADIHLYSRHYWGEGGEGSEAALPRLACGPAQTGTFAYRTPVTDVVAWALRRATAATLSALLSDLIWSRIGAEYDAFFLLDPAGHEIAGAGLCCTLRDLARVALLLRNPADRLPAALIERLRAGGDRDAFAASGLFPTRPGWSYRSFWWVRHAPSPALSALGVFGQRLVYDHAGDLIFIRFGSHPVASSAGTDPLHDRALAALAIHLQAAQA